MNTNLSASSAQIRVILVLILSDIIFRIFCYLIRIKVSCIYELYVIASFSVGFYAASVPAGVLLEFSVGGPDRGDAVVLSTIYVSEG